MQEHFACLLFLSCPFFFFFIFSLFTISLILFISYHLLYLYYHIIFCTSPKGERKKEKEIYKERESQREERGFLFVNGFNAYI